MMKVFVVVFVLENKLKREFHHFFMNFYLYIRMINYIQTGLVCRAIQVMNIHANTITPSLML